MTPHYQTHLYGFAYAVLQKQANETAMRRKALANGHTEGECQLVENNPLEYIHNGFKNPARFRKASQ